MGWVRYHHIEGGSWRIEPRGTVTSPKQPALINDHLAYNITDTGSPVHYWVPDLIVECEAEFGSGSDTLVLELNKADDRFQAVFANGKCKLVRLAGAAPDKPEDIAEAKSEMAAGTYHVRLANVDSRLTVWVDGKALSFDKSTDYEPPNRKEEKYEPTTSDLHQPARIGATGTVAVSRVQLWRDVYYTCNEAGECKLQTYYIQPGHYFCLGDNSASSADGRSWGLVPERLMLGKAVVIYWPMSRIRVIK
jgi:signal peptidase I